MHRHIQIALSLRLILRHLTTSPEVIFYVVRSKNGATISLL